MTDDEQRAWFRAVDADPEVALLLTVMEETAQWQATRDLRAFERAQLALGDGERLLDVGCGLGDAALALATDLAPTGEVVGIDASDAMVSEAERRAVGAPCAMRFMTGDALALDVADHSFDAVRSERMLQWVPDPARAVAEMARAVRPGGRVCLTDTDWSTCSLEVADPEIGRLVREAYGVERNRPSLVGARLAALAQAAGLQPVAHTAATQVWSDWDFDARPRLDGLVSLGDLADDVISLGQLDADRRDWFITAIEDGARAGDFTMRLTMHAVVAVAPA